MTPADFALDNALAPAQYSAQAAAFLARYEREERAISPRSFPPARRIRADRLAIRACGMYPHGFIRALGVVPPRSGTLRISAAGSPRRDWLRAGLESTRAGVWVLPYSGIEPGVWLPWERLRIGRPDGRGARGYTDGRPAMVHLDELESAAAQLAGTPYPRAGPAAELSEPHGEYSREELALANHPAVIEAGEAARIAARIAHLELESHPIADVRWVEPADPVACRFRRLELQRLPRDVAEAILLEDARIRDVQARISRLEPLYAWRFEVAFDVERENARRVQRRAYRLDPW